MSSVLGKGAPPSRQAAGLLAAYGQVPQFRAVVDKIATSIATNRFRAFELPRAGINSEKFAGLHHPFARREVIRRAVAEEDLKEIAYHPVLNLLTRPNPTLTTMQIKQVMQAHIDIVGEAFVQMAYDKATRSMPMELWPILPTKVKRVPTIEKDSYGVDVGGVEKDVAAKDIIWMKSVNPANIYGRGLGLAAALSNELDADEYSSATLAARFWNNATPELLISMVGATTDNIKLVREQWMQGLRGAHKAGLPHFTGEDIKVEKLDVSMVDLDIVNLKQAVRDWIRELYGVPPEILGQVENSNRATITVAMTIFAINVLIPRLEMWQEYLNTRLVPMFGENSNIILLYDSPMPDDRDFVLEMIKAAPFAFTVDEIRILAGRRPLVGVGGELHPLPRTVALVDFNDPEQKIDVGASTAPETEKPEDDSKPDNDSDAEAEEPAVDEDEGGEAKKGLVPFSRPVLKMASE